MEGGGLWNTSAATSPSHIDEAPQPGTTRSSLVGNLRGGYSSGSGFVGILQPYPGHRSLLRFPPLARGAEQTDQRGQRRFGRSVSFLCVNLYQSQS